jgi:multiple sugar transport system substrate-binding protein
MRRIVKGATILLFISVLITACGNNSAATETTPKASTLPKESIPPKEIVISGFASEIMQDIVTKHFPQYHFTFYKNSGEGAPKKLVETGSPIDIYYESIGQYTAPGYALSLGLQYDMKDLVKKHNIDLKRFDDTAIQGMQDIGGLYGIPLNLSPYVLYYNKDVFDKFGVSYPKDGMTWDQTSELAKKLNRVEDNVQYVGFVTDYSHPENSNQLSIPYVDPKTGKASIGSADWQSKWKVIFQSYFLNFTSDTGYQNYLKTKNPFLKGPEEPFEKDLNVGMMLWFASIWNNNPEVFTKMNWDMVAMPTLTDAPRLGPQPYSSYLGVASISKNMDDAMIIIKYLVSDEVQMQLSKEGIVSALKSDAVNKVYGQNSPIKGKNLQAIFYNKYAPQAKVTLYDQVVQRGMNADLDKLIRQQIDMNTYINIAEEKANKAIEAAKK